MDNNFDEKTAANQHNPRQKNIPKQRQKIENDHQRIASKINNFVDEPVRSYGSGKTKHKSGQQPAATTRSCLRASLRTCAAGKHKNRY